MTDVRSPQQFAYHISSQANRASIEEHGIEPGGDTKYRWGSTPTEKHVWVFGDEPSARSMAGRNWGGSRGHNDIWEINTEGMELHPDPHQGWGNELDERSHVISQSIPPERIRRLRNE